MGIVIRELFYVSLISFMIFAIIEIAMPGFVSRHISFEYLIWIPFLSGIAYSYTFEAKEYE